MRLTLDWDSESIKETHLEAVKSREPAEATEAQSRIAAFLEESDPEAFEQQSDQYELWQSSGGEGYHYIEYNLEIGLERQRQLRQIYGDDQTRINMDGERIANGSPFINVMYHLKEIRPGEMKPYATDKRAELLNRAGFDESTTIDTKNEETGRVDYQALVSALSDHPDFDSRAALFRRVQQRESVSVSTRASARGYDIAEGRRSPTPAEKKALRDYAMSREIGHYSEGTTEQPAELATKPSRTTFHEYMEVADVDFDTRPEDGESKWYPANLRTGTYGEVDEMTLKQVHGRIADAIMVELSPGPLDLERGQTQMGSLDRNISLERERPLDKDEVARYRRVFADNQPAGGLADPTDVMPELDPFAGDKEVVAWEMIVYEEDYSDVWWLARGVVDVSDGNIKNPLARSTIVADTRGWL